MKLSRFLIAIILIFTSSQAFAVDFFSTEKPERLLTFGARFGVNTSNITFNNNYFEIKNVNSWGTGIEAGAVANLNFRDYITVQPGIFFQSRSGKYVYATSYLTYMNTSDISYQMGNYLYYDIMIPVMACLNFNIADNVKWSLEAGPYLQINVKKPCNNKVFVLYRNPDETAYKMKNALSHFYDYGIKLGSGIKVNSHFYFGIHYDIGLREVWGFPSGGHSKAWTFTVGYDF